MQSEILRFIILNNFPKKITIYLDTEENLISNKEDNLYSFDINIHDAENHGKSRSVIRTEHLKEDEILRCKCCNYIIIN